MTATRSALLGLGLWLAARSLGPVRLADYPLALASAGLASVIGFLAVFAPAGLGVHEMIYLNTMRSVLGDKVAVLVLLFRALHVMADVVAGAIGTAMVKWNEGVEMSKGAMSNVQ